MVLSHAILCKHFPNQTLQDPVFRFCSYCACASSYYAIGLMDRVDFTIVATAHVRDG